MSKRQEMNLVVIYLDRCRSQHLRLCGISVWPSLNKQLKVDILLCRTYGMYFEVQK